MTERRYLNGTADPQTQRWHIDRRIPVAQILALLGSVMLGTWFIAELNSRVSVIESAQTDNRARLLLLETGSSDTREQLAKMTVLLESIDNRAARLERQNERSHRSGIP